MARALPLLLSLACVAWCLQTCLASSPPLHYEIKVIKKVPHSNAHFTQGFMFRFRDGALVEGTGLVGHSRLVEFEPNLENPSAKVRRSVATPGTAFGEGITEFRDSIFQLTWREGDVYEWRAEDLSFLRKRKALEEPMEGWGLTTSPSHEHLLMTDGSANLYAFKPLEDRLEPISTVAVKDCYLYEQTGESPFIGGLNELETMPLNKTHPKEAHSRAGESGMEWKAKGFNSGGLVWANIYGRGCVVAFDPDTGDVRAYLHADAGALTGDPSRNVMNGIAYRDFDDSIWMTGKNWEDMYQIELVPLAQSPVGFPASCRSAWNAPKGTIPRHGYPDPSAACAVRDSL